MGLAEPSSQRRAGPHRRLSYVVVAVVLGALLVGVLALSGFPGRGPVIGFASDRWVQ